MVNMGMLTLVKHQKRDAIELYIVFVRLWATDACLVNTIDTEVNVYSTKLFILMNSTVSKSDYLLGCLMPSIYV